MHQPAAVTFRDVDPSPAVQSHVDERAGKLVDQFRTVTSCRVTIGRAQKRARHGDSFEVRVDVHAPHLDLVAETTSGETDNLYGAIDAAFDDLRTRLHDAHERARDRRREG